MVKFLHADTSTGKYQMWIRTSLQYHNNFVILTSENMVICVEFAVKYLV